MQPVDAPPRNEPLPLFVFWFLFLRLFFFQRKENIRVRYRYIRAWRVVRIAFYSRSKRVRVSRSLVIDTRFNRVREFDFLPCIHELVWIAWRW